ncbi:MAG: hypothetical protein ABI406_16065 [Ktedonobacteraceae bacterium]
MDPYSNNPGNGGSVPSGASQAWGAPVSSPGMQQGVPVSAPGVPAWGGPGPGVPQPQPSGVAPTIPMFDQGPKWPALRTIASVLKIIAWIEGVLGIIAALVLGATLAATVGGSAFLVALFLLVAVAVEFLLIYASSEIIMLFISIEKNTRTR